MTPRNRIRIRRPKRPGYTALWFVDFPLHERNSAICDTQHTAECSPDQPWICETRHRMYEPDAKLDSPVLRILIPSLRMIKGYRKIYSAGNNALGIYHDDTTTWEEIRDKVVTTLDLLSMPYQIIELPREPFLAMFRRRKSEIERAIKARLTTKLIRPKPQN